ncbi:hypothetical protein ACFLTE_06115 [Bacteroidota bacterium]
MWTELTSIPRVPASEIKRKTNAVNTVRLGMRSEAGDVILLKIIISLEFLLDMHYISHDRSLYSLS